MRLRLPLAALAGTATLALALGSATALAATPHAWSPVRCAQWRRDRDDHVHPVLHRAGATALPAGTTSGTSASGGTASGHPGSMAGAGSGSVHASTSGSGSGGSPAPFVHPASAAGAGSGAGSGHSSGSGSGTGSPGGSGGGGSPAPFVQGTGAPSVQGGLQVGGGIDGLSIVRVIHLTATAYGATAQDNYPYGAVDAFGVPLRPGDVAVDPAVIALNTKMYVAGYSSPNLPAGGELAVARDTGGAIKGQRIDMFINSTNESVINNFGIQQVTAYILD